MDIFQRYSSQLACKGDVQCCWKESFFTVFDGLDRCDDAFSCEALSNNSCCYYAASP